MTVFGITVAPTMIFKYQPFKTVPEAEAKASAYTLL